MPELFVKSLIVSPFETNCYITGDSESREAIIIDPGDNPNEIIEIAVTNNLIVKGIVNTHGHADHIAGNQMLTDYFGCPLMIHELDAEALTDPEVNLSAVIGYMKPISPPADKLLRDGDEISAENVVFHVLHTPGHTVGGICLLTQNAVFSGDTLFAGSIGRSDFPGGSHETLLKSIREKLLVLPDEIIVYPGHGPATTIGVERRSNPWL